MRLQDKVAIVTGAGSGIGRATAVLFAQEGARLVLNDIDQQSLQTVLAQVGGEKNRAVVGNVAQEETARRMAQEAVSKFGRDDVLVNNAGVHFLKDIIEMTVEEWDRLMLENLAAQRVRSFLGGSSFPDLARRLGRTRPLRTDTRSPQKCRPSYKAFPLPGRVTGTRRRQKAHVKTLTKAMAERIFRPRTYVGASRPGDCVTYGRDLAAAKFLH